MKIRGHAELPEDKARLLRRAARLQWALLAFVSSSVVLFYFVMGGSQAMKSAWLEDMLALAPPAAFLIAIRIEAQAPDRRFPLGKYRAISIAFLISSAALLTMGGYLCFSSLSKLATAERPTIGSVELFGATVWSGWLMIAALFYSMIAPVAIGRMTEPLADALHDKSLHAGAAMAMADWKTALAAIIGILGVGFGLWWADAVAATLISLDVLRDGALNTWRALKDLADEAPTTVAQDAEDPVQERIAELIGSEPWITDHELQLREEGRFLTGVVFVAADHSGDGGAERLARLGRRIQTLDWRLYDVAIAPTPADDAATTPAVRAAEKA